MTDISVTQPQVEVGSELLQRHRNRSVGHVILERNALVVVVVLLLLDDVVVVGGGGGDVAHVAVQRQTPLKKSNGNL